MIDPQHEYVKEELAKRGISFRQIAIEIGVSAPSISIVSQGFRRSKKIEEAIALRLETTVSELWPDRV